MLRVVVVGSGVGSEGWVHVNEPRRGPGAGASVDEDAPESGEPVVDILQAHEGQSGKCFAVVEQVAQVVVHFQWDVIWKEE